MYQNYKKIKDFGFLFVSEKLHELTQILVISVSNFKDEIMCSFIQSLFFSLSLSLCLSRSPSLPFSLSLSLKCVCVCVCRWHVGEIPWGPCCPESWRSSSTQEVTAFFPHLSCLSYFPAYRPLARRDYSKPPEA